MNKYLKLIILLSFVSCKNIGSKGEGSEVTRPDEKRIEMDITKKDNQYDIVLSNVNNNEHEVKLWINGAMIQGVSASGIFSVDEQVLKLGLNNIMLTVNHKSNPTTNSDTLTGSIYFSYDIGYSVIQKYTHNIQNFTEGLFIDGNTLYESTGLEGQSKVVKYRMEKTELKAFDSLKNIDAIFGEGVALHNGNLYQLTWKSHIVYQYDKQTLKKKKEFQYPNEGWGLCVDGNNFIASDGTSFLYYINPANFSIIKKQQVTDQNGPVKNINELELVNDIIVANVWETDTVIFISKNSGHVIGYVDFSKLAMENKQQTANADVLNGIAYDPLDKSFIITGKLWSWMYKIKFDKNYERLIEKNRGH